MIKFIRIEAFIALILLVLLLPLFIITAIAIKFETKGSILFWSKRYGIKKKIFLMPKFRSMVNETPIASTQTLIKPEKP